MSELAENPGCLGFILKLFGLKPRESEIKVFPYAQRDDFLSEAEFSFYKVLMQVVDPEHLVCPKVGLQDIFFVTERDRSKHMSSLNKINRKHVDFLVCNKQTMKPVYGIELDDTSHQREDRVQRDQFVNRLFEGSGVRLVRVVNKKMYALSEVKEWIKAPVLPPMPVPVREESATVSEAAVPLCSKCSQPMVLRISGRGENKGKSFYGCANYPKCRETAPVT